MNTKNIFEHIKYDLKVDNNLDYNLNYYEKSVNRYKHVIDIINKYHNRGTIVELGGFPFHLTASLSKLDFDILAVDIAPERSANFIRKYDLNVMKSNVETDMLPFDDDSVEFLLFLEVFEHLRIDPISTLKEINRILCSGGYFIISVPNLHSIFNLINIIRGRGFDDAYFEFNKIHRLGHMGHVREYSNWDMLNFLKNTDFDVINTYYKSYDEIKLKHKLMGIGILRALFPKLNAIQTLVCKKK